MSTVDQSLVQRFNVRLSAEDEGGMSASWCKDFSFFQEILQAFPGAPVDFVLRNFTRPDEVRNVQVRVPGLGDSNRAYYNGANIVVLFPNLRDWLVPWNGAHEYIGVRRFIERGEEIATLIGREFRIIHMYGSGDPCEADYKDYGPFKPK